MTNTLTAEQTRIADLESALHQARAAIMKAAEDTLWCEDSPAETVVDRIDAALGGEDETADLFPPLPSPPVLGEAVKPEWVKNANAALDGYEADLGGKLPDDYELGRIEDNRTTPSFRIRVGHIRGLLSPLTNEPVGPRPLWIDRIEQAFKAIEEYDNQEARDEMAELIDRIKSIPDANESVGWSGDFMVDLQHLLHKYDWTASGLHIDGKARTITPMPANEPVGVTTREDIELVIRYAKDARRFVPNGEYGENMDQSVQDAIARLSAAIGERG